MNIRLRWRQQGSAALLAEQAMTAQSHDLEPRVWMFEAEKHGGLWSEVLQD